MDTGLLYFRTSEYLAWVNHVAKVIAVISWAVIFSFLVERTQYWDRFGRYESKQGALIPILFLLFVAFQRVDNSD